ncbi:MAG: PDZ domain-containing protein [Armatimonas sp.]
MTRREACYLLTSALGSGAMEKDVRRYVVAPNGKDTNPGTLARPFQTLPRAQQAVREARRQSASQAVTVLLRGGTYYLDDTLVFTSADSGSAEAPVVYEAYKSETPVISGGIRLSLTWRPYKDGIWQADVPAGLISDQLFVNGKRQTLARYPNHDPQGGYFDGWSPDAWSPERAQQWANPRGGFLHAMHRHLWGDFHYVITEKDAQGKLTYEGGWQNNRRLGIHDRYRFVENIFEELDAPGEWFLNPNTHTLYFYPPAGVDISAAMIEMVRLKHLVELRGTPKEPVRHLSLRGLTFRHAARTFMENREPLLRSDWTIYRGGALLFTGAEDCALADSTLEQLGGNAVFVSGYNRRVTISGCHIPEAGANGVCFVGEAKAVRGALFEYEERQELSTLDRTPGPRTPDYPEDCCVDDCLIYRSGRVEKQTAPVQIAMARRITVRHCSLYDVPRAGINIGDGCWGGHVIEHCDVFDTVKETGDHGSFNSWGRDRWWGLKGLDPNTIGASDPKLPLLDTTETITLRNNRWRCDHGWDIDLDDGSSNYHIHNNLCLSGGIKNREGFYRTVENNIIVNNSFHPHVWYRQSSDVLRRNIVFTPYRPIEVPKPWGKEIDQNLLHTPGIKTAAPALALQEQSGRDAHSLVADAEFTAPETGDYRVGSASALALGFTNFPMDRFGVQKPSLRALARTPALPAPVAADKPLPNDTLFTWLGTTIKTLSGLSEASAVGVSEESGGVLVVTVAQKTQEGLQALDLVQGVQGKPVKSVADLRRQLQTAPTFGEVAISVRRAQQDITLKLPAPVPLPVPKNPPP